ncbi:MAG: TolC family protein [Balneolaceae bacterium]
MRILLTATLFLLLPLSLLGQSRTITLEEAIQISIDNNYQLKQAANTLDLRHAQETSAFANLFPSLSASMGRGLSIGRQFDETTGNFDDLTISSFNTGLSSNITVFNGFANINNLRSARLETLSQEEQLRRVRENVIFNTASSYLQYLLNRELLDVNLENLETAERQLEQVRAQVEEGMRPNVDLLNQEAEMANAELQVVTSENQLNMSRIQLVRQLQIDPLGDYEFVEPEVDLDVVIPQDYDLRTLVNAALETRADLKSEEHSIEASFRALQATRASLYPSVSLGGSFSSSYSNTNRLPYHDQFFDQNIRRSLSLSISIPIFNRLNSRTNVRSQEINYKNAQLALENTRLQVTQEVNQAYNDYLALIKEMESTERALRAAERAYETEQQRYEVGASTLIELSQSNTNYIQAQSNRLQTLYNFLFQEKLLDYYIGRLEAGITL